jgi:hypothetical protein
MIFQPQGQNPITAALVIIPRNSSSARLSLPFQMNPETIRESVKTKIDSVYTINSNLPRSIITGTEGREISFTAIFHAQLKQKDLKLGGAYKSSWVDRLGLNKGNLISTGVTMVPFASNIARGVKTIADLSGYGGNGYIKDNQFEITSDYETADIESVINLLYRLQVARPATTNVQRVQIFGYPAYRNLDFYIAEITVNRRMWDENLRTQFAEVQLRLVQAGANYHVGRFFQNENDT